MLKLKFELLNETKTCYRFQSGSREAENLTTLYLKKSDVTGAGIDPKKGITVTVEEGKAMGNRYLQYWNKTHTKVLRVQQSLSSCNYRVVSIRPEHAETYWASGAIPPSWATDRPDEASALDQLQAYAGKNHLEPYMAEEA